MDRSLRHTVTAWIVLGALGAWGADTPTQGAGGPGPWPQWRGPDGQGVSADTDLPVSWAEESPNIRWKAQIRGDGCSSPIVSRGRVIVTEAFESPLYKVYYRIAAGASVGLTVVFLVVLGAHLLRARSGYEGSADERPGWPAKIVMASAAVLFIGLALLATAGRGHSAVLFGPMGRVMTKVGLPDVEHLISLAPGVAAAIWLTSGGISLLGFGVALGLVRGLWRVMGVVVLGLAAAGLIRYSPLDQWTERIELYERALFVLPGVLLGLWHFGRGVQVTLGASRGSGVLSRVRCVEMGIRGARPWSAGPAPQVIAAACLVAMAGVVFAWLNVLDPTTGMQRAVVCMDMTDGRILWEKTVCTAPAERIHSDNSYATPTAATDGRVIVVNFGVAMAGLDFDGRILWKQEDPGFCPNTRYGSASSPVIVDDKAFVLLGQEHYSRRPGWIWVFDLNTGQVVQQALTQGMVNTYVTPMVYGQGQGACLLVPGLKNMAAYDCLTGCALWAVPMPQEQIVASPVGLGRLVCLGGTTWGPKSIIMMRMAEDSRSAPETVWQQEQGAAGSCSPVIYEGRLYTLTDEGLLSCLAVDTGQVYWTKRLGGRHLASLVEADGKIYACSTQGVTTVIDVSSADGRILARNHLKGRCHASPAIAQGCLLLRVGQTVYCIEDR